MSKDASAIILQELKVFSRKLKEGQYIFTRRDDKKTQLCGPRLGEGQGGKITYLRADSKLLFQLARMDPFSKEASSLFPGPRAP